MRIAFYPAQSGKVWNGATLQREALGGSETAVIYVAQELAKLGHEVIVFTKDEPGMYSDVLYIPFDEARALLRTLPLDALVGVRDPIPLLWQSLARKKLLWLHDLPQPGYPTNCDAYICVSNWQASLAVQHGFLAKERTAVIHNGIDPAIFTRAEPVFQREIDADSIVTLAWTSNPERGLWHAIEVLHRVRQTYPHAELRVYGRNAVYGWNDSYEHHFHHPDMTSVILHAPLAKADLADALGGADLWLYPTWWPETYCIAAVEAQAAGVPVVASTFAALTETCATQRLVPGSMRERAEEHLTATTDAVLELLGSVEERRRLAQAGRAFALSESWANQAQRWEKLLQT